MSDFVNRKRKVCVVVASRANYGRIKTVIEAISRRSDLQLQLVVGASALLERFGSAVDVIRQDGFEPDSEVFMVLEGGTPLTMAKSTGLAIIELASVFQRLAPDIVVTVADRYETIATAIAASYMNIPVAHTQGGELTGSIDESVRHAVTKLSHLHFPATVSAGERLQRMGEHRERIFVTGCPAIDLVARADRTLDTSIMEEKGVGDEVKLNNGYLLVMQHPVTTEYTETQHQIDTTIAAIERLAMPTIWLWPNVDAGTDIVSKRLRQFRENRRPAYLRMFRNFPPEDYVRVMANALCVVGNTSSSLREGAFLGVPAVDIGSRQQGRERAENVAHAEHDVDSIERAIRRQLDHGHYCPSTLYGDGTAGVRIAEKLATVAMPSIQKSLAD